MKSSTIALAAALGLAAGFVGAGAIAQSADTPDAHVGAARAAYAASAEKFRDLAAKAGADALISNHTRLDGSKTKMPALALRKPGDRHPYVIGPDAVQAYMTVAGECAKAVLAGMKSSRN